jgi:hypothetical protein
MKKYLISLPIFHSQKGFNCQTILVKARSEQDAICIARHIQPNNNIGSIKEVYY